MPETVLRLDCLAAVRVFVFDLQEARKFYGETLGLDVGEDGEGYSTYALGAARLIVEFVQQPSDYVDLVGRFTGFSLQVDDVNAAYEALRAKRVTFLDPPEEQPWGGKLAHFEDPDENILTIVEFPAG